MKSPNTKSSEQLKAEVHQGLKRVEHSIENLQRRLTPGQILDDVVFYPRGKSLKGTLQHLRENPVGTTFLSLGTVLLMEDNTHHSLEWSAKQKFHSAQGAAHENVQNIKEAFERKFPREKREDIKTRVKEKISQVKDSIETKTSDSNFSFETEEKKGRVKERAQEIVEAGKEKIRHLDSLSFMALGAGLGAVTGTSIPLGQEEKDFIHQKLGERLSLLGDDIESAINQSSSILKDLIAQDLKDYDLKIFK
jgi:hypothetical protein